MLSLTHGKGPAIVHSMLDLDKSIFRGHCFENWKHTEFFVWNYMYHGDLIMRCRKFKTWSTCLWPQLASDQSNSLNT